MRRYLFKALALLAASGATQVSAEDELPDARMLYCMVLLTAPGETPAVVQNLAVYLPRGLAGPLEGIEVFDPHSFLGGRVPDTVLPRNDGTALLTSRKPVSQIYLRRNPAISGYDALIGHGGNSPKTAMCKEVGGALAVDLRDQFRTNPASVDDPK